MTTPDPVDPKHDPHATENRFSGIHPDNSYPLDNGALDEEQERRLQARQETEFVRGEREERPAFTERYTTNDHAARREAETSENE